MRKLFAACALLALALASTAVPTTPADYQGIRQRAEELVAQRSYKLALEAYERVDASVLPEDDRRWVAFRLADLKWRSAPETADPTIYEAAQRALESLLRDAEGQDIRDRAAAEALESLGDLHWNNRYRRDWGTAWQYYARALDWWAGTADVDLARRRYLDIVWKATESEEAYYPFGYYAHQIPLDILENAVEIAVTPNDRSHANYLLAMHLANRGDANAVERARQAFEAAIQIGRGAEWHDDALFNYGQWLTRSGLLTFEESGQFRIEPDYEGAVAVFRRFLADYSRGTSRYWDQAKSQLDAITQPSISLGVPNVFLPGSEIVFSLSYRNVPEIELTLSKVDLTRDITSWPSSKGWIEAIDTSRGTSKQTWKRTSNVTRPYGVGQEQVKVDRELATGAWVLEARGGGKTARDIIIISQASIVTRTAADRALVWVTDARTGAPQPAAKLTVWQQIYESGSTRYLRHDATTDSDGLAEFSFDSSRGSQLTVFANAKDHQAFASTYSYGRGSREDQWRIYAVTDRPAYRPGETAKWKITARIDSASGLAIPGQREVRYEIRDPRGTSVAKGTLKLNSFGSAWAETPLDASMALGAYTITFENAERAVGGATLFRLEEYKLPEFRVVVRSGDDEKGEKRLFRPGDRVEAIIEASYYFGGPVVNATVEAVVYQTPYYRWWIPEREYPWYFDQQRPYTDYGPRGGEIIKREVLTTDAEGRARIAFDTPAGEQDWEYRIEAKVTDASRREITASDSVRVTRAPYFANARPSHWLHQPGDSVEVRFRTVDANDQPVSATGIVKVTREEWIEVWLDPKGNEVSGRQLEALRARGSFPPPREEGKHAWQLIRRGYEQEEITKATVTTDAKGEAEFRFTAPKEGFYRVSWSSRPAKIEKPRPRDIVNAETTVWVATNATTRLGYYREGGVEIVLDQDSVRPGATVPVMIAVPTADRHVLFSVEHERILSRQIVRPAGNVKLIQLQLGNEHIPNVFLTASMVMDLQLHQDTKELIVPPVEKFLTVEVKGDREEYEPRQSGTLTITTRDASGKPVPAEVSLGVADESVYAIQEDFAGDPRPFFYGQKRGHGVQTSSSFWARPYIRLVEEDGQLVDDRYLYSKEENRRDQPRGGVGGRLAAGMMDAVAQSAVAEAITVAGAPPPPPAAPEPAMKVARAAANEAAPESGGEIDVRVRSDFRSTLFWQPDIITDASGTATVKVDYADSLTTWRSTARAATAASQFGFATSTVRTNKPLIARLQAPRFFVVGDQTVVSAVFNNNTAAPITVTPALDVSGLNVTGLFVDGKTVSGTASPVSVPPNGEARVDWSVAVKEPGTARLRVTGRSGQLADSMEKTFPVEDHGIDKLLAVSGKIRADEATLKLDLPARRSTTMTVQVAPSIAVTMLDALPYLIDYPYGCTEQTMSRFLPAVIVSKTLSDLGISREVVASRIFGGIERQHASKTHPDGKKDLAKLDDMVRAGLARLYDFQHDDGGWGWWKEGESDHWMSAYVVWGLHLAREAGINVRADVIERGASYLAQEVVEEELNLDRQAWMLHALSAVSGGRGARTQGEKLAFDNLWQKRDRLSSYGLALYALSAHQYGMKDRAATLAANLENGAAIDRAPDTSILVKGSGSGSETVMATAHWGARDFWWRWYDSPVESTATALRALSAINPNHRLVEPSMNWLVKNRRGAQWSNTRDTAIAVLALNQYLKDSRELAGDIAYEVSVNGTVIATKSVSGAEAISAPSRFEVPAAAIRDANSIRIRRTRGTGPLYVAAEARFFSLEEPVKAAGQEIFLKREYAKLVGRPTLLKGYVYDRVPMKDGDSIRSGERVEVTLTVEVKNDYEYLLLEDLKPAGLEATELISGEPLFARQLTAATVERKHGERGRRPSPEVDGSFNTQWVYRELRDRKVALFIDRLSQGVWEIRYSLRAEVPGSFHALPLVGGAMYVPEIRGNSDEVRITVLDR